MSTPWLCYYCKRPFATTRGCDQHQRRCPVGTEKLLGNNPGRTFNPKPARLMDQGEEAARRKATPIASGVLAYFPDALAEVARVSKIGNDQHNPGQPLHWAKEKSTDELDALARHLSDRLRGEVFDTDTARHLGKVAWRALAALQREIEAERASK